jgi:DNA-binding transcriptional LysR family regulator
MQTGSLSGASRLLGLAQPTIRRQIEALEAALGAALFTRAPNGLTATPLASTLVPHAEAIAASARALMRAASASEEAVQGTVRLTASEIVGTEVLPPILARFCALHPELAIELVLDDKNQDLLRREADLAVRMATPSQKGLVRKRAGTVELGLFAAPAYLSRRGTPSSIDGLKAHAVVGPDRSRTMLAAFAPFGLSHRDLSLRTDHTLAQLAAVRAGVGIGVAQLPLAAGLRRVLPTVRFELPLWVVTHEDLKKTKRISALFDHLVKALGRYAESKT